MENASKALIIAGSVLISIMVISLLVFGYNQLSNLEQTRANSDDNVKMAEYMRRFEQFNRTLYGSEILSLANLQEDYNNSVEREDSGYDIIKITVITNGIYGTSYFSAGTKDISFIVNDANTIKSKLSEYEKKESQYNNKSVKYYASKSEREIALDFDMNPPSNMASYDIRSEYLEKNAKTYALLSDIEDYTELTSIYTEFRTGKQFKCKVQYNEQNGRINEMIFEEI